MINNKLIWRSIMSVFLLLGNVLFAQTTLEVHGKVTDSKNLPLTGVNIIVKGTKTGTITDFDGEYSLKNLSKSDILVFSYVGFKTKTIEIANDTEINVMLEEDASQLQEVEVTVAYGKQKRISVVGAQSTVDVEELQQPVGDLTTTLAGRIAGLTGVQRSGLPGYDGADIWIRGISTFLNAGTSPLVLVDGVERSMNNVDPKDIASFSILKDASATAVYGIRGANGVILIQTKKGKIGKPQIDVDYNEGVTFFTKLPDLADGVTYMKLANEATTTRGSSPIYTQEQIDRTESNYDPYVYPNVDWFNEIFKDFGRNRQAHVNVSGGAEKAQYYVALGYYDETGLLVTDGLEKYNSGTRFKRYNFTTNLNIDVTKTTKLDVGVQGYVSQGTYPAISPNDAFNQAMMVPPVAYPKLYPGNLVPGISSNNDLRNPYADVARRGYNTRDRNQIYSNLRLTQNLDFITKGLSLTGMFAFDTYNEHSVTRSKRQSTYYVDVNNPYKEDGTLNLQLTYQGNDNLGFGAGSGWNRRFYIETSLNYDRSFGDHQVSGLLLFNRSDYTQNSGDLISSLPYRNQGLAARITYSFNNKYFLELNGGYNGSENFAPKNRYGFFPSIAAGWVISNEDFFEPLSNTINFLKIRYSDGLVGASSGAGRFAYLSKVSQGQSGYNFGKDGRGISGIAETYQGVDVTWSQSRKQDLGLELNAFDNSLKFTVDVFKEHTTGAFLQRNDVTSYIGFVSSPFGNIGVVDNKGFDGTIEYTTKINEFSLSLRGTFSYNKNKVIENGVPEQPEPWMNHQGDPVLANYGYIAERLFTLEDDKNGDGKITADDGFPVQNFGEVQPGDIKYKDLNGDGRIDAYDVKQIGDGDVPALTFGLGTTMAYKSFDFSMFFQGQKHADRRIGGLGIIPFSGDGGRGNMYKIATDRWTPENNDPYALYPRLSYGSSGIGQSNNTQASTWWIRNIDFIRLKSLEFGYTLPEKLSAKAGLNTTRFYFRATNVFTLTNFNLWDPELNTSNGGSYPNTSVCSIGVNFQF
ncbi:SusC/RagA family TonB-linked outer membrane protein [Zhouia sp. PK063]|uniref:SusC/RagA family TonB-linked outer membrane protein n=1 Tax=Zhouia sp. PK063 TaxID=3373602 RepID=UPI0037BA5F38